MSYDPPTYSAARGRTYATERSADWSAEDSTLVDVIDGLYCDSVLDLGCGYGRVGASIQRRYPGVSYTGLDVSDDLAETTRTRLGAAVITADLATFDTICTWDLVLAISVLGHLLPEQVPVVLDRMRTWALRDIVVMDWDETGKQTDYQFAHDYRSLMPTAERIDVGRLAIYHERVL